MYEISFYRTQRGDYPVRDFISEINKRDRAKIYRYIVFLQEKGAALRRPYTAQIKGKLRELRIRVADGNVRIFYFFFLKKDIILLHAFKKKSQAVPEQEISNAEKKMRDFIIRYERGEFK
ncbi:type II toxin-antitoxin system RelE/ParE family toxin [bacterium]|nr:type II toxin-antitoxin system RelE/ParE family toxin [bacterium]MBU3956359.1 type II toxin-antitoxin system RelE/ParE family toxin [bacterium]